MTSPWDGIPLQQVQSALESITLMVTGSKMLADESGVLYALSSRASTDCATVQAKNNARQIFNIWVQQNIAGTGLQDLYQGVFRVPDTNVVNVAA